jgi:hypothetical protein
MTSKITHTPTGHTAPRNWGLEVRKVRGWFAIYAGVAKLSKGFRKEADAKAELEKNEGFYGYWAGSMSVNAQNRVARGEYTEITVG